MSRNKRRNLWVGWCVSPWRPWFWSVYLIYYYIHNMYYSCFLSIWNELFLIAIYIPRIGVAMTMCWIRWYCYSFMLAFKCMFLLYSSGVSISWYGYGYRVTLCVGRLGPIMVYRTGLSVCVFSGVVCHFCSFHCFLDRVLFHRDGCDHHWDFYAHFLNYKFMLSVTK